MSVPIARSAILDIFEMATSGPNQFRSVLVDNRGGRMFGGWTVGQAMVAARVGVDPAAMLTHITVDFYRPADGGLPCEYRVERLHDGRTSASRSVAVLQNDVVLATASVTFNAVATSEMSHGSGTVGAMLPDDVGPTGMPHRARAIPPGCFDIRYYDRVENGSFVRRLWFRALDQMPSDTVAHQCAMALISDLYFFEPVFAQHGIQGNDHRIRYGTTQHSLWFHRPPIVNEWHVIESASPAAANGRGLVTGRIQALDGTVIATAVQEVAVRFPEAVEAEAPKRP